MIATTSSVQPTDSARAVGIAILGVVILMANNGLIIAGLTAFDSRIIGDLHLSVTALKLRDMVTIATLGLAVPLVGFLLDKISARLVIVTGLVAMALGLLGYRFVHGAADIYAIHVMLGLSQAFCGLVSHIVLISRWMRRYRGVALGGIVAGSSVGNALAPMLNAWLASVIGWRNAVSLGGIFALALIPLVLVVYRERPVTHCAGVPSTSLAQPSFWHIMASRNFWLLAFTAATTSFCILSLATSLILYVQKDLHASLQMATQLLLLLFSGATGMQLLAGFAADRIGAGRVHVSLLVVLLIAAVMLRLAGAAVLPVTVFIFGASWGGSASLLQIRPVILFPSFALGRTLAGIALIETIGACMASPATALLYDFTGHYTAGFSVVAICAALALGCVVALTSRSPVG